MKVQYIIEVETKDDDQDIKVWVYLLKKILKENLVLCSVCGDYLSVSLIDEDYFIFNCPTCSKVAEPILEREYDYLDFGYFDMGHFIKNKYIQFKVKEKIK